MKNYKKNKKILEKSFNYNEEMERDACGVGLIASTNGKKSRKIVEYGIQALKAIWHRGAVDADGKSGDGAGIQIEIAPEFFKEKILSTGHTPDDNKTKPVMLNSFPLNTTVCSLIIVQSKGTDMYVLCFDLNPAIATKLPSGASPFLIAVIIFC